MTDIDLVRACIRGSASAWDELVERCGSSVYDAAGYTLRRVLGSAQEEDIENVVQGVFLGLCDKGCHRLKLYQGRSTFRTWVISVTSRFALNYIRTEKRKGSLKYCWLDDDAADLLERDELISLPNDERDRLFQAMEELPQRDRLLLKLFYFDGLSYKAIAELIQMPLNSVSPMIGRAKESLRKKVGAP